MIRCITFDLDDTLWAVGPVVANANQQMLDWLAEHAPLFDQSEGMAGLGQLRQQVITLQPDIAYSVTLVRRAVLALGLSQAGYQGAALDKRVEGSFQTFYHARQQVAFFEHAMSVISQLKAQGYLLGAITNGNADIRRVGLDSSMTFQVSADGAGVAKPDPAIFTQALVRHQLQPGEVIHVGDNPDHDVAGAKAVGMRTVWVNLTGQARAAHLPAADAEITCLSELPQAVERIHRSSVSA